MKKLLCLLIAGTLLIACEKDEKKEEPKANNPEPTPTVQIAGVQGSLIAVKISTTLSVAGFEQTIISGSASAHFTDADGNATSAGDVSCMDQQLSYESGTYFSMPDATNPNGMDFNGSAVKWESTGNGAIPSFSYSYPEEVPEIGGIIGVDEEVEKSQDFTLRIDMGSATDISSVDSLIYNVIDEKGKTLTQVTTKSTTAVTFSSAEMKDLSDGFAYVQVVGYNYTLRTESGYKLAFINMGALTKNVTLK